MTDYLKIKNDFNDADTVSILDELSFWSARFGVLLFNNLEMRAYRNVLDLACGLGFPLFELAHILGRDCHIAGVDIWRAALQRAKLKLSVYQLPNVSLLTADGVDLPIQDAQIDLIISNLGINNFADPQAVLKECYRVLRSDGKIILTTNLNGHFHSFYQIYRDTLLEMGKHQYLDRLALNENHRGTKASIGAMLQAGGFKIGKTIEDSFQIRYLNGSAMLRHALTRFGFIDGWRNVVSPDDEEEIFSALEKQLNLLAQKAGELKMNVPMLYIEATK
jgi:ubiquinone/menaquinone biosynthesis C-methylase UbiE